MFVIAIGTRYFVIGSNLCGWHDIRYDVESGLDSREGTGVVLPVVGPAVAYPGNDTRATILARAKPLVLVDAAEEHAKLIPVSLIQIHVALEEGARVVWVLLLGPGQPARQELLAGLEDVRSARQDKRGGEGFHLSRQLSSWA